jgi:hypothetical protein
MVLVWTSSLSVSMPSLWPIWTIIDKNRYILQVQYHMCKRSRFCSVNLLSAAFVLPVILFSVIVTLENNVIFRYMGARVHLKSVPVLSSSWSLLFRAVFCSEGTTANFVSDYSTWNWLTSWFTISWKWLGHSHKSKRKMLLVSYILIVVWLTISCHLGFFLRSWHSACCLEIFCILEISFSEPDWCKCKCKSALVRMLFFYALPDLYISAQVNKDLVNWLQYCTAKEF